MKIALLYAFLLGLLAQSLQAQEGMYEFIERKQQEKTKARWSLADWLALKNRNGLMDQWLALNTSPNIMDFNFSLESGDFDHNINGVDDTDPQDIKGASLALHFNIIGIEGQYKMAEKDDLSEYKSRTGLFYLRILGHSTQSTHIALQYGVHLLTDDDHGKYDYEFMGVSANFYFLSFLGFEGSYRNYMKTKNDGLTSESWGRRLETGFFLEIGFVRLFAKTYKETLSFKTTAQSYTEIDEGSIYGLKVFF